MNTKTKMPEERHDTIRREILDVLTHRELTINELSKSLGKSEKELYDHLEALRKYKSLKIIPAECMGCGFVFEDRERVKKPGKCPKCKSTRIDAPLFNYTP